MSVGEILQSGRKGKREEENGYENVDSMGGDNEFRQWSREKSPQNAR